MQKIDNDTLLASVHAVREFGSQRKAAKALGIVQSCVCDHLKEARKRGLISAELGSVEALESKVMPMPGKGEKAVYILTSAQDHTKLHPTCFRDLKALADHDGGQLMIATFRYNKEALGQRANAKFETREQELAAFYPTDILPYVCDDRVDLTPNLSFCGELNVLPTAEHPLSGLESYTYRKSTIVPHPKLALQSVPSMQGEGVKLLYTTGCVTMRNYIKRKVGYKAEHFHSYGALIVEVDDHGSFFCRQLQVGNDGAICDLDRRVKDGKVTTGHKDNVYDLNAGDAHWLTRDAEVYDVTWGKRPDSIVESLHPFMQHIQDLLDNSPRSHHQRKDPHAVFKAHFTGDWNLGTELRGTANGLYDDMTRPWLETYVVDSNHNRHLDRFIKEVDWRDDPVNARLILGLNLKALDAIANGTDGNMSISAEALKSARLQFQVEQGLKEYKAGGKVKLMPKENHVQFLLEDESHVILPDIDGGIESGLHGDRGANGAKGTISGIAKTDRKVNAADKHTVAIMNHAFFNGTSAKLVQGWNKGMSSWTAAHTLTYYNGARTILSIWRGKWRA